MRKCYARLHSLIFQFIFLSLTSVTALNAQAWGACPAGCQRFVVAHLGHKDRTAKLLDVKAKNVAYLKAASGGSPSVRVKVSSNIMMCDIALETSQNNIESNKKAAEAKGCQACLI